MFFWLLLFLNTYKFTVHFSKIQSYQLSIQISYFLIAVCNLNSAVLWRLVREHQSTNSNMKTKDTADRSEIMLWKSLKWKECVTTWLSTYTNRSENETAYHKNNQETSGTSEGAAEISQNISGALYQFNLYRRVARRKLALKESSWKSCLCLLQL